MLSCDFSSRGKTYTERNSFNEGFPILLAYSVIANLNTIVFNLKERKCLPGNVFCSLHKVGLKLDDWIAEVTGIGNAVV